MLAGDITLIRHFDLWDGGVIPSTDAAGIISKKTEIEFFSSQDAPVSYGIVYDLHPSTTDQTRSVLPAPRWTRKSRTTGLSTREKRKPKKPSPVESSESRQKATQRRQGAKSSWRSSRSFC